MAKATTWIATLFAVFAALQGVASATMRETSVPCGVFGPPATCANPISEGVVDGQWLGLVLLFNGTNGGPTAIDVVTVGFGGNGFRTLFLTRLKPVGTSSDRIGAAFHNGKLIISNALYLPGEAHCCFTHIAVRRFGFHNRNLVVEREATVPSAATAAQIDSALDNGPHYF